MNAAALNVAELSGEFQGLLGYREEQNPTENYFGSKVVNKLFLPKVKQGLRDLKELDQTLDKITLEDAKSLLKVMYPLKNMFIETLREMPPKTGSEIEKVSIEYFEYFITLTKDLQFIVGANYESEQEEYEVMYRNTLKVNQDSFTDEEERENMKGLFESFQKR